MPSSLHAAFGKSFTRDTEPITSTFFKTPPAVTPVVQEDKFPELTPLTTVGSNQQHMEPIYPVRTGDNYVITVNINRDDCHLLCLFIGVFTLAVLLSKNKTSPVP